MEAASSWMAWQNILEGDAWHSPSSSHHRPAELLAQAGTSHVSEPCRKLGGFSVHRRDDICTQPWTVAWQWKEEAHSSGRGDSREQRAPGRADGMGGHLRLPSAASDSPVFPTRVTFTPACSTLSSLLGCTECGCPNPDRAPNCTWTRVTLDGTWVGGRDKDIQPCPVGQQDHEKHHTVTA